MSYPTKSRFLADENLSRAGMSFPVLSLLWDDLSANQSGCIVNRRYSKKRAVLWTLFVYTGSVWVKGLSNQQTPWELHEIIYWKDWIHIIGLKWNQLWCQEAMLSLEEKMSHLYDKETWYIHKFTLTKFIIRKYIYKKLFTYAKYIHFSYNKWMNYALYYSSSKSDDNSNYCNATLLQKGEDLTLI